MMRVLVCGGRNYADKNRLFKVLDDFCIEKNLRYACDEYGNWLAKDIHIIHGGASGADDLADQWAVVNWVTFSEFKVTKEDWVKQGKAAGPLRNQRMLDEGKPDIVIAFPGGPGTADMCARARKAGIEVREIA